jgi:hypothetical protein
VGTTIKTDAFSFLLTKASDKLRPILVFP